MKRIIALSCIAVVIYGCSNSKNKPEETIGEFTEAIDEITNVRAVPIGIKDFNYEIISNGTVQGRKKANLKFNNSENVVAIYVKNGDRVVKGQKIAALDQFKLKNAMEQAKESMERARLDFQDVLIGQGYSLNDSSNIPESVTKIARLRSNYDQNINQYRMTEYNYRNSVLYAPFDGIVANLFSKEYNYPPASEPFCTIIDINNPEILFMVLEDELALLKNGDKVIISPYAINNHTIEGHIVEINPVIDKNGMVRIKAVANGSKEKLYDGMNVKVRIQQKIDKQLIIPKEALVLRTNRKVVFTAKNGQAIWNYVHTGMENSEGYVVTEGLAEGDSVIYEGNINLSHEAPINVIK